MRGGVTGRQRHRQRKIITWLCRTGAFGALVNEKYGGRICYEKRARRVRQRTRRVGQRSARWRCRETEHREQSTHRTKTKGYQGAWIEKTGWGNRIFSHKIFLR